MLTNETLQQIKNAEIDIEVYNSPSRVLPAHQEENQCRESLLKNGLINPIIISADENNRPFIVDGNLRYKLIRELKAQNKWETFPIKIHEIPLEQAKNYREIQTNHKNYTKFQLAMYAAYHYWDDVEKESQQRRKNGSKIFDGTKGKTSAIVGSMGGVNEKYAESARKILEIDREFFYNLFFIHRFPIKKDEIHNLIDYHSNNLNFAKKILDKMKEIFENQKDELTNTDRKSIFAEALAAVINSDDSYKNVDADEITEVNSTPKSEKNTNQKQHDKNAQQMLQTDEKIKAEIKKEIRPIGISFQSELSEDELEGIFNILQCYRLKPILIKNSVELENFKNGLEETL